LSDKAQAQARERPRGDIYTSQQVESTERALRSTQVSTRTSVDASRLLVPDPARIRVADGPPEV
jgi:hypothetical protein